MTPTPSERTLAGELPVLFVGCSRPPSACGMSMRAMAEAVLLPCHTPSMGAHSTPSLELTATLLTDRHWRQRVVEKIRPQSADHYELRRSFQFEIAAQLLDEAPSPRPHPLLLPVCWLPKEALLDLDVTDAAGTPLMVLERRSIAGAMGQILDAWQQEIPGLAGIGFSADLLESICAASLSPWRQEQDRAQNLPAEHALHKYIKNTLGVRLSPQEASDALERGRALAKEAYNLLQRDSTREELDNTATGAAILLPYLVTRPGDRDGVFDEIDAHHNRIERLLRLAAASDEALGWLWILIEAGVRWPLLVTHRTVLDEPFLIKVRELRPSGDDRPRVFRHDGDLAAARSYHLDVEVPDPALRIAVAPSAQDLAGVSVGAPEVFESTRWTEELFTAYTSLDDRPDRVSFQVVFGLGFSTRLPYSFALAFVVLALPASFVLNVDPETAAVLTITPTLVSGYLVTRDVALVTRFLLRARLALVAFNVGLWSVVLWKLVT